MGFEIIMYSLVTIAAVLAIIAIILKYKKDITDENYYKLVSLSESICQAAEQLAKAKGWTGEQKKEYVANLLKQYNKIFKDEIIDAIIESAVFKITQEQKKV